MTNPGNALEMLAVTDIGLVRNNNEDAVSAYPDKGLVLLADGMGGYSAGEVASNMAIVLLARKLERLNFARMAPEKALSAIAKQIEEANQVVYQASLSHLKYAGMGTTLVVGCFTETRLYVAHLGDSRAYRFRDGDLTRLTRDHSLTQEMIDSGLITEKDARASYGKHVVSRALGATPEADPECHVHEVEPADLYLFCSDGLVDMVEDAKIARILNEPSQNLIKIAEKLVYEANNNGGLDNISLILVRVDGTFQGNLF